jgi:hypothetical protein
VHFALATDPWVVPNASCLPVRMNQPVRRPFG